MGDCQHRAKWHVVCSRAARTPAGSSGRLATDVPVKKLMKLPGMKSSAPASLGYRPAISVATYTQRILRQDKELPSGDERIVVVDDDKFIRHGVRRLLEELGYDVECFNDGLEAIAYLADSGNATADLVLTDYDMPNCNGYRLAQYIRYHHPRLRVLLCSAWPEECIKPTQEVDDWPPFLSKPFQFDVLAHKLREVLDASQRLKVSSIFPER
jgi:CheY-like chemotaxis protein